MRRSFPKLLTAAFAFCALTALSFKNAGLDIILLSQPKLEGGSNSTRTRRSNPNGTTVVHHHHHPPALNGTFVLQLAGEFGNHLGFLSNYHVIRTLASEEYDLRLSLHVRKQRSKSQRAKDDAARNVKCLKSFRDVDFGECDWHVMEQEKNSSEATSAGKTLGQVCADKVDRQLAALRNLSASSQNETIANMTKYLHVTRVPEEYELREILDSYVSMLQDESILALYRRGGRGATSVGWSDDEPYPFIYYDGGQGEYDRSGGLQDYFAFDEETAIGSGCCLRADQKAMLTNQHLKKRPRKRLSSALCV